MTSEKPIGEAVKCHGGVKLTTEDLRKLALSTRDPAEETRRFVHDRRTREGSESPADRPYSNERVLRKVKAEVETSPLHAESQIGIPLLQAPEASISWPGPKARTGINPADTQIAVSRTHVVVTTNDTVAFYQKDGTLLQSFFPSDFFIAGPNFNSPPLNITGYSDVRGIFDPHHSRFLLGLLVYSLSGSGFHNSKFVLAVSISEDPTAGWYFYWWDAVAHDGVPNDPVFRVGDGGDYPCLGVDNSFIFQTNSVNNGSDHRYWHVVFFPLNPLVNGQTTAGWQYWDLTNPDGNVTREVIQPAIHHSPARRAYFVSRYYAGGDKVLIWALQDPLQPTQQISRVEVAVTPFGSPGTALQGGSSQRIQMDNLGTDALKAVYRDNWLYFTMNDGRDWFSDGQTLNSVRLVRLNVANYPAISTSGRIDRVFGGNSSMSDAPTDHMYYGWPALEVNRAGDVVIVYARTGGRIFPEVRYSTYLFTEGDIRPSRLLKAGEDPYLLDYSDATGKNELRWGDTAGASVDPADDTAIWIAQAYASDDRTYEVNNWAVWIGKVFVNSRVP